MFRSPNNTILPEAFLGRELSIFTKDVHHTSTVSIFCLFFFIGAARATFVVLSACPTTNIATSLFEVGLSIIPAQNSSIPNLTVLKSADSFINIRKMKMFSFW